ncbi:MAG: translation elongation factor Ts [Rickettsiales bacterium]|jgi:elongation factor Ts|nr:translation elongation factor Ts [Rickettsiales bacterium]
MSEITSNMVKELREKTFAGMMDCKKALTETGGDMAAAADWLREKGILKAAKKSDRVAAAGLVAAKAEGKLGVLVEVNSETDFTAKNGMFTKLATDVLDAAYGHKGDLEATRAKMADALTAAVATIGENMVIRRAEKIEADSVLKYVHNSVDGGTLGQIGVLVGLNGGDEAARKDLGLKIAMHVAAAKPDFLRASDVKPEVIEKEKKFFIESGATNGKPEQVVAKMIEGRINKFFGEVALEEQAFVMEPEKKVKQVAAEQGMTIAGFARFLLGDGIEKVQENLADEVAKTLGN